MNECMAYAVDEGHLLMGWVKITTGETRQWRCNSLRHMMLDPRPVGAHDPFADVEAFMHCVDRVVSYGFPTRATDPGYTRHVTQYRGTDRNGNIIVNDTTGDVATIYTKPNNDWAGCAYWRP